MSIIYGFNDKDVLGLIQKIKLEKCKKKEFSPTRVINEYSQDSGLKVGTVRNMYYSIAKKAMLDSAFCNEYLDGKSISIAKITQFSDKDERLLLKDILTLKSNGMSIRKATFTLANGDNSLALRYQNKYRSCLAKNQELIASVLQEISLSKGQESIQETVPKNTQLIGEVQLKKLKNEINNLMLKISEKTRKENDYLKQKLSLLELENARLKLLFNDKKIEEKKSVLKYFNPYSKNDVLN